jgi:hypothetical protein
MEAAAWAAARKSSLAIEEYMERFMDCSSTFFWRASILAS